MNLSAGGAFVTQISEDGTAFSPHMNASFLVAEPMERIVFSDALTGGWRPAAHPFMTAVITFRDHAEGTEYAAHVMHRSTADRNRHQELGFYDGWGTVIEQLAALTEGRSTPT
jgi:uncharacterized protein YndB with AHSA1/START domain